MSKKNEKKTALVLSGGGARGAYEAGVWQALTELGIKIDIITGTSVGAINAAMVAQGELELACSLWKEMETHMVFDVPEGSQPIEYAREIVFNHGAGTSGLKALMEKYIDEEKVRNSPMEFGITAVSLPDFKPHLLFKEDIPQGKMIDFIMASASAFPAIHSYPIDGTEYIDGGYADVLPMDMALSKNPTHVIAVNLRGIGIIDQEAVKAAPNLVWIETPWDLGLQFIFDVDNARRLLRLGYLDAMKAFGVLDGHYYAFSHGTFDKTTVKMADACAKIFEMDPTLLYTKETFLEKISDALAASQAEAEEALESYRRAPLHRPASEIKELIKNIKSIANQRVLTYIIAYALKEKGQDSILLTRPVFRLLSEQIPAARFLVKYGLV